MKSCTLITVLFVFQVSGEISYNGCKLEFPQNTAAYISQYDLHMPEMTVRETLDFSARCQGVGTRAGKCIHLYPLTRLQYLVYLLICMSVVTLIGHMKIF